MSTDRYRDLSGHLIRLARLFVERELDPWPEFVAALIVGSVAHGEARPDSDVDCILVFDPLDERIVPAEFVWIPETDSCHTIFEVEASEVGGVQIDAKRMSLEEFRTREWEEGFKHDLADALVLRDRSGEVTAVLEERLRYPEELRRSRVAKHCARAWYYAEEWRLKAWLARGGPACAHDQLDAAFGEVVELLHAYNAVWMPWRYRWLLSALKLPWLPEGFGESADAIVAAASPTEESLAERRSSVVRVLDAIGSELRAAGLLADPGEAFAAAHPELGYGHNMDAWRRGHERLLGERTS